MTDSPSLSRTLTELLARAPQDQPVSTPPQVSEAVASGQYADDAQATTFIFAENFDTFDAAAEGGEPDGKVSEEDIAAVANSAPGEYPPELVEFAQYLLSERNAGVLDRLDKGSGTGGDDGDVTWQDVANVLKLENPPPSATLQQQAAFADTQLQAILNAESRGDFDAVEVNEALALVFDGAPVSDPAFATAVAQSLGPESFARMLELAQYSGGLEVGEVLAPLQGLMSAAMQTEAGAASITALTEYVIGAPLDHTMRDHMLATILGSSAQGPVARGVLEAVAGQGLTLSGHAGTGTVETAFFQALATNPEAALAILQAHPEFLNQEMMEHNPEFTAAVDALLESMTGFVEASGDPEAALAYAGMLDQLARHGAAPNRQAVADAIERTLPLLVEGLVPEAGIFDEEQRARAAQLGGDLVMHYLAVNAGDDPERNVAAAVQLMESLTRGLPMTPDTFGNVIGLLGAGMLKHFEAMRMSAEDAKALWSGLANVASEATGFAGGWGAAFGTGFQAAAAIFIDDPQDDASLAYAFVGAQRDALENGEIQFESPTSVDDDAQEAITRLETLMNQNGFPS